MNMNGRSVSCLGLRWVGINGHPQQKTDGVALRCHAGQWKEDTARLAENQSA